MSIVEFSLKNFRNHADLTLNELKKFVIISGNNGVGKTNVLEAISFFSPGRGLRSAQMQDLPCNAANSNEWSVFGLLHPENRNNKIGTGVTDGNQKRIFRVDDETLKKQQDILNYIRVIWLTPQMDGLFLESPSIRRKFLDRLSFNFVPEHAANILLYQFAMRSRNKLIAENHFDDIWLNNLESQMALHGLRIAQTRLKSVDMINSFMEKIQSGFIKPRLEVIGSLSKLIDEDEYKQVLKDNRMKDKKRYLCCFGPHLSDFKAIHITKNANASICSTGEQKAMLISLILSQIVALNSLEQISPIVLLDEIFAHLDKTKISQLIEEFQHLSGQFWITTTETSQFPAIYGDSSAVSF